MSLSTNRRKRVSVCEVAAVLKSGFLLVTGSVSDDGCPIIFMLDNVTPEPSAEEQSSALIYLSGLPSFSTDADIHYYIIVDRRRSTWSCVHKVLNLLKMSFENLVKEITILPPSSFFQRKFSSMEANKLQQEYAGLQITLMDNTEALVRRFGDDNLCVQLGGIVTASPESFIQQRMSIDSLEANCVDLEERVKGLFLADAQSEFDIPNDVASTEALINEHSETRNNLTDEISNIKAQGEVILKCFREEQTLPSIQKMLHIQEVQRLTVRLEDLEDAIKDFWEKEEAKLQECMKLREFHEEFKSLQHNMTKLSDALVNVTDFVTSVEEAKNNIKRLNKIHTDSKSLLERASSVAKEWTSKLNGLEEVARSTVSPKCDELLRVHDLCKETLQYKQMLAEKQVPLYSHLDEAKSWLLDQQKVIWDGELENVDSLSEQLRTVECQLAIGKFLELQDFEVFLGTYKVALADAAQAVVEELHKQVAELMSKYESRKAFLIEELSKLTSSLKNTKGSVKGKSKMGNFSFKRDKSQLPPLSCDVISSPSLTSSSAIFYNEKSPAVSEKSAASENSALSDNKHDFGLGRLGSFGRLMHSSAHGLNNNDSDGAASTKTVSSSEKISRADAQDSKSHPEPTSPTQDRTVMFYVPSNGHAMPANSDTVSFKSGGSESIKETDKDEMEANNFKPHSGRRQSIKALKDMVRRTSRKVKKSLPMLSKPEVSHEATPSLFERSLTAEEEQAMASMRSILLQNLIQTEERYVEELKHIIEFYLKPIAEAGDNVPNALYSNQSHLFSNLEEIYDFNSRLLLPELRENRNFPSAVASTFKHRCSMLLKYKEYCSSRSRCEVLLRQLQDDNFLLDLYRQHENKATTLSTLLLSPAKRIVAYKIFLQSMLENLRDDEELQREILGVLSSLADTFISAENLLHQVTIEGYQVELSSHGSLLHQGRVLVSHDKKSSKTKFTDFKAKSKYRQLFLFTKCAVFCKIQDVVTDRVKPFTYMHAVQISPETVVFSEDNNKVILRGNHESYLVHSESDQKLFYENLKFAIENSDERILSHDRSYHISPQHLPKQRGLSLDDEEVILDEDPDVDMFALEDDLVVMDKKSILKQSPSNQMDQTKQYILSEDFDNDLLLGRGDIVECVSMRKDMMEVRIPGTGIKSWLPCKTLLPYR